MTVSLIIDGLATYIPFRLLRPLSLAHAATSSKDSVQVPNNEVVSSVSIQAYTTILASVIYAATLHAAYNSYLPIWLVTYFDALPSVAPAHNTQVISLLPTTLLLGFAAKSFIFTPAVASAPSTADANRKEFNPGTATLAETFWHNVWGFDKKTKIVILRTLALMSVSGGNTFLQTWVTINGVEAFGAAGYSAVWLVAAGITGAVCFILPSMLSLSAGGLLKVFWAECHSIACTLRARPLVYYLEPHADLLTGLGRRWSCMKFEVLEC